MVVIGNGLQCSLRHSDGESNSGRGEPHASRSIVQVAYRATTYAGPDQAAAKDMITHDPVLCLLLFSFNCHEHRAHLTSQDNVKVVQTVCASLCAEAEVETVL